MPYQVLDDTKDRGAVQDGLVHVLQSKAERQNWHDWRNKLHEKSNILSFILSSRGHGFDLQPDLRIKSIFHRRARSEPSLTVV